ncbi:MAG: hypothetical protein JW862_04980 [Anaerolineales bacterium]|nr:hypothetical protein [Anaerolineales bacterium]
MFSILIFLIGFFASLHGASQFSQDIFTAAGYLILGIAIMLMSPAVTRFVPSREY